TPIAPEPAALRRLAELLTAAERPLLVTGYAGRDPEAFGQLVELAETVGAGVIDTGWRLSFPNRHELNVTGSDAVEEADCVLFVGTASDWAQRTWDFDRPYRHPGRSLGTATQIGISLGVALAHKGSGRLVVDLQPDGDLMFDLGALWIAAYHRIPLLAVMFNNRAYYNDWEHQERIARSRGTDVSRAYIGLELDKPAPDLAAAARATG